MSTKQLPKNTGVPNWFIKSKNDDNRCGCSPGVIVPCPKLKYGSLDNCKSIGNPNCNPKINYANECKDCPPVWQICDCPIQIKKS